MARDNDKGLYLPLKINLDEWERDLTAAGNDLRKSMRKMSTEMKDLKLKYEVEISGAEAAGNKLKTLQLQTAKMNQLYDLQKRKVDALNKAYQQSVKETGAMSAASQQLSKVLDRETIALNKMQKEINSLGEGLGKKISDKIASISPEYAKARVAIGEVTSTLGTLTSAGVSATAAIAGLGLAVAGIAAVKGMDMLDEHVQAVAKDAAGAAESVFALRENFNLTTKDAEEFAGIMAIDGTNAEAVASAMRKLNKQLETAGEDGNLASKTLEKYGVSLKNADGSIKSMKDQVKALADGYQKAKEAGDDLNFVTNTLGAGGSQFTHLLNGFDDYLEAYNKIGKAQQIDYENLHLLQQKQNELAEAMRQVAIAKGQQYTGDAIQKMDAEIERRKKEIEFLDAHKERYKDINEGMKQWGRVVEAVGKVWDKFVLQVTSGMQWIASSIGGKLAGKIADALGLPEATKEASDLEKMMKQIQDDAQKANKKPVVNTETDDKKTKDAIKKAQEAQERLNEALFNAQATDYQKAIHRIELERDAYIKAGASEVDAERLFTMQKEAIDKAYYDKLNAEQDRATKEVLKDYEEQLKAQKKMQEASISDAERTLKSNVQLIRKMQKEMAQGGDWQARVQEWQDKRYMKQNGFKQSDITALQSFGVDFVKKMADSTNRLFGSFGNVQPKEETVTNNNNTTINIDRPIVTDESLINQLADKVADKMRPLFAGKTAAGNSF